MNSKNPAIRAKKRDFALKNRIHYPKCYNIDKINAVMLASIMRYGRKEGALPLPAFLKGEKRMIKQLKNRSRAFYGTLICSGVSVITMIVYAAIYASTRFMAREALLCMTGGVLLGLVLLFTNHERFAPSALLVGNFLGLLFYIYHIYFFVSSVVTGIQFSGFPPEFFVNAVMFGITLVLSIVCVFLPCSCPKEEN